MNKEATKEYIEKIKERKYNKITFRYFALMEILSSIIGVFIIIFFLKKGVKNE